MVAYSSVCIGEYVLHACLRDLRQCAVVYYCQMRRQCLIHINRPNVFWYFCTWQFIWMSPVVQIYNFYAKYFATIKMINGKIIYNLFYGNIISNPNQQINLFIKNTGRFASKQRIIWRTETKNNKQNQTNEIEMCEILKWKKERTQVHRNGLTVSDWILQCDFKTTTNASAAAAVAAAMLICMWST